SKDSRIGLDNFDVFKHSLVVGMSGSGKTKFLNILTKAIKKRYQTEAKVVIIDPHREFSRSFKNQAKIIDFKKNYLEPLEVGKEASPMTTQLIQNLIMSIIGEKNKYSDRVLFYSIHLLSSLGELNLQNISRLLTDSPSRMEYLNQTENEEVKRFFSTEFDDIYMNHFNEAVLPVLNFIGEYELYMGEKNKQVSLLDEIEKNEVVVISFDPHFFGRKMTKFLAGAVLQQMYILAITRKFDKPIILLVDEFPIVENKVIKNMHAETRKFNLHLYLSMQYLNQLEGDITDSILTNTYNYIVFKCNRQDAGMISSMIDIKVEEYFKKQRRPSELEEEKKDLFVNLMSRECVVRLFEGQKYLMPMKVSVVDSKNWDGFKIPKKSGTGIEILQYKKDDHQIIKGV
ncbi:ATP-binding protein, partial [Candidatus Micrarchaeota archaeon]|nr:ATP-binding protein [Candidatus Micrarchaeota archaeon]